jgi:hypothetical protein
LLDRCSDKRRGHTAIRSAARNCMSEGTVFGQYDVALGRIMQEHGFTYLKP